MSRDGKSSGRLPTFKAQRDLTLGSRSIPGTGPSPLGGRNRQMLGAGSTLKKAGVSPNLASSANNITAFGDSATKKKFTPNLNVQRRQPPNENAQNIKQEHEKPQQFRRGQGVGSPNKRELKKPFQKPEFIQTMGAVFSEGIGEGRGVIRRSRFGGGIGSSRSNDGETGVNIQKPKLNFNIKVDKDAEAERLKELLRDDFIDDLTQGPLVPVQLPMIDTGAAFKEEETKDDLGSNEEIKGEKKKNSRRILDSDDDSDAGDEQKDKVKLDLDDAISKKSVIGKYSPTKRSGKGKASTMTFPDLVRMQKGDLLFVQLPDYLPGNLLVNKQAVKQEGILSGIKTVEDPNEKESSEQKEQPPRCTLNTLPEGYLGKIQIRKSGKTQLLIGDTALDVDLGTQVGFLQDLVSINIPTPESDVKDQNYSQQRTVGDMTVLGHVRHRVVVSPDWGRLFDLSKKQSKVHLDNSPANDSSDTSSDEEIYNKNLR